VNNQYKSNILEPSAIFYQQFRNMEMREYTHGAKESFSSSHFGFMNRGSRKMDLVVLSSYFSFYSNLIKAVCLPIRYPWL